VQKKFKLTQEKRERETPMNIEQAWMAYTLLLLLILV
jgi:hypothetical protein